MDTDEHRWEEESKPEQDPLTQTIIGCAYTVSNTLGTGFLEKVYENAMKLELENAGLQVTQQSPLRVWYRDQVIGEYVADLIVGGHVLVERKHCKELASEHVAQCLNYLKVTRMTTCLLINFGTPRITIKRLKR